MDFTTLDGAQSAPLPQAEAPVGVAPEATNTTASLEGALVSAQPPELVVPVEVPVVASELPAPHVQGVVTAEEGNGLPMPPVAAVTTTQGGSGVFVDGVQPPMVTPEAPATGAEIPPAAVAVEAVPPVMNQEVQAAPEALLEIPPAVVATQLAPILAIPTPEPAVVAAPVILRPHHEPDRLIHDVLSPPPKEKLDELLVRLELVPMSDSEHV